MDQGVCIVCDVKFKFYASEQVGKYCSWTCAGKRNIKNLKGYSLKGAISPNKGIHRKFNNALDIWRKNGGTHLGQKRPSIAGKNHPMFGKIHTKETRKKMSLNQIGKRIGENNPNWKGGITTDDRKERVEFRHKMQRLIFERDGYKCQLCNATGALQVDHIQSWGEFKELRFDPENCRTLCAKCHYKITFGREMPESVKTWGHNLDRRVAQ